MGHPYSLSHPFTVFFQPLLTGIGTLLSTQCMRLLKSKAEFHNHLLSVVICRNYPHCNSLNPHTKHAGAERASSMFCHHVDPRWEGIPCAVETKSACIVSMAPPHLPDWIWMWRHFLPSQCLGNVLFVHLCIFYFVTEYMVLVSANQRIGNLCVRKLFQFCLTFNYTQHATTGHWACSSNTYSSTYT